MLLWACHGFLPTSAHAHSIVLFSSLESILLAAIRKNHFNHDENFHQLCVQAHLIAISCICKIACTAIMAAKLDCPCKAIMPGQRDPERACCHKPIWVMADLSEPDFIKTFYDIPHQGGAYIVFFIPA